MNIAVLSDIHGNYIALQKRVRYAVNNNINTFIFLEDYLGELAYPRKTMEITFSIMEQNANDYILCGHTHRQGAIIHNGKSYWRFTYFRTV